MPKAKTTALSPQLVEQKSEENEFEEGTFGDGELTIKIGGETSKDSHFQGRFSQQNEVNQDLYGSRAKTPNATARDTLYSYRSIKD